MEQLLTQRNLIRIVRDHAANVCQTMLGISIDIIGEPAPAGEPRGTVVALIGLTGRWNGSGTVSCSAALAKRLSGRLFMTEFEEVDAEVLDAMGEIANMVIGNVKEDLARDLGPLAISTPTVIHGEGLQTRSVEGVTSARAFFECDGDVLEVRVSLVPSTPAAA